MTRYRSVFAGFCATLMAGCATTALETATSNDLDPVWENASVYFLMTDRFRNGDPSNDGAYGRVKDGDVLRSFEGGDIPGIIKALEEGYFRDLGVTAIWTTPVIEQIQQPFEEFGRSYAFHGYWPRDWTKVDEAYGTEADFARMVELAHSQGIRILVDIIVNHAGPPINATDPAWPSDWVDTGPACDYQSFAGTADCLIVPALQEMRTESTEEVDLPPHIEAKWRAEGRYEAEMAELDAFFERTGLPRTPRNYLIKWNTDWVREYGVDGFRIDTAKHVEPEVWALLKDEASAALEEWRAGDNTTNDWDTPFYMMGEVFNFGVDGFDRTVPGTRKYDFGDIHVDFYDYGFDALINMGFPTHAAMEPRELFALYAEQMDTTFEGVGVLSYLSSHDDKNPRDPNREDSWMNAAKLLLAPGGVQIYYGDETDRGLVIENAVGDATLRSPMNWDDIENGKASAILEHWQRLTKFRKDHPAIGGGRHMEIATGEDDLPFTFARTLGDDAVVVALSRESFTETVIEDYLGSGRIYDAYSDEFLDVVDGRVRFPTPRRIALLEMAL